MFVKFIISFLNLNNRFIKKKEFRIILSVLTMPGFLFSLFFQRFIQDNVIWFLWVRL